MLMRPRGFASLVMPAGLLLLTFDTQSLLGQQYCVSGAITSISSCNGCGFKVGDPVAFRFTIQPGSVNCTINSAAGECTATPAFGAQLNGLYWNTSTACGFNFMSFLASAPGGLGAGSTQVNLSGSGTLLPEPNPPPPNFCLTNSISLSFPGNLLSSGQLPSVLPTAASFSTATLSIGGIGEPLIGSASFSYTGQTCAQAPTVPSLPSITAGGIVPLYSAATTIEPGEWVSIYGNNLAAGTETWNGDFPTSLGGTNVTINGKPAYLWFVSPGQINLQAPDDTATGSVPVVVTTAAGAATSSVTLGQFAPSFNLFDAKHVAGIIPRSDGSGAYGNGAYDILGPTGSSLGFPTVAAKAGDVVELFGVGFGPTSPSVKAGIVFSGSAPTIDAVSVAINHIAVIPSYAGIVEAGLYQLNVTIPATAGTGDVALEATVGGAQTPTTVVISLR